MKQNYLSILLLTSLINLYAQCPNFQNSLFTTQEQIDNFSTNYPNCNGNQLSIRITGNLITNLNGLAQLTTLDNLSIRNCQNLNNLHGLHNIESSNEVIIENCDLIQNLNGLEGLTEIGRLEVKGCDNLLNLSGLNNLINIGFFLALSDNVLLNSLKDLENITSFSQNNSDNVLLINNNPNLTSLNGIGNIQFGEEINGFFGVGIFDNLNLAFCSETNLCELLNNPNVDKIIENNSSGCNSEFEIISFCENLSLIKNESKNLVVYPNPTNGTIFFDSKIDCDNPNIKIFDSLGKNIVYEKKSNSLEIKDLRQGIYLVKIDCNYETIVKKILKK